MEDELLNYYERELTFIRRMAAEFARKYPKIAGRLLLEPDKCEDPHTERLIEAFAFLSGRIHKKIDDDFPEITESLLNVLYPHYVNPIPSMSVVRFEPVRQNIPATGYEIPNGAKLYSKPAGGIPCQFVTCYPVTLWPVEVTSAEFRDPRNPAKGAQQALVISLRSRGNIKLSQLNWESLRFFLNGPHQHVFHLYELLLNNVCHIELTGTPGLVEPLALGDDAVRPAGFEPREGMLPRSGRTFPGYLLLFEYFCFPEKFLFFDLGKLDRIRGSNLGDTVEIWIYLNTYVKTNVVVNQDTFAIHASPVVNLFKRIAEPIRIEQKRTEYQVIPDVRRQEATEIFSVDKVTASLAGGAGKEIDFKPFYSLSFHGREEDRDDRTVFWHMHRRPSGKKGDEGTEVFLSFVDPQFRISDPEVETLTVHITCSNRDLPGRLPFGDPDGDFTMEIAAPVSRIHCLVKPTPAHRPSLGRGLQWRLLSHLSLNYLSLVSGGEDALKEMLRLYDFENSPATRQQIDGIISLNSEHVTRRIGQSFCRGIQVTVDLDETKFVGAGVYLFASILERFLGQYVSINSFSQLVVRTTQRKEVLRRWPSRSGNQVIL